MGLRGLTAAALGSFSGFSADEVGRRGSLGIVFRMSSDWKAGDTDDLGRIEAKDQLPSLHRAYESSGFPSDPLHRYH